MESGTSVPLLRTKKKKSLRERLGNDDFIGLIVSSFFDEILEDSRLRPIFSAVSKSVLKVHQANLLKVMFGPQEARPSQNELIDYMTITHTRVFRENGVNEEHFDRMMTCFEQSLKSFQVPTALVEESLAELLPLRKAFEYGAKVTNSEKAKEEKSTHPISTAIVVNVNTTVILPVFTNSEVPPWVTTSLKKARKSSNIRKWTSDLIHRLGPHGDVVLADTLLDMPYIYHHYYFSALIQLALLPDDPVLQGKYEQSLIHTVRYPRGASEAPLPQVLYQRLVSHFVKTCDTMQFPRELTSQAKLKLSSYLTKFPKNDKVQLVGGTMARPYLLRSGKHITTSKTQHSFRGSPRTSTPVARSKSASRVSNSSSNNKHCRTPDKIRRCYSGSADPLEIFPDRPGALEAMRKSQQARPRLKKKTSEGFSMRNLLGRVKPT